MNATIIVAALGYFVDVFDLLLFSILRVPSLKSFGLSDQEILEQGIHILNLQLSGLVLGGILWGIAGDKFGRISVLFGSILLYSVANLGCAYVQSVEMYSYLRFVAGFGLAGELGAGITLVAELLSKEHRGWGATVVTAVGVMGAVAAGILGQSLSWRTCYLIGRILGLLLLIARMKVAESKAFKEICARKDVSRGSITLLIRSSERMKRYLRCIMLGLPLMYVVYVFVTFSPEIGKSLSIQDPISAASGIMYCYIGITIGDFLFGAMSQLTKSRRTPILTSIALLSAGIVYVWYLPPRDPNDFYLYAGFLGFFSASWAVLLTTTAEQFGTNLRATVTTSVPNMIRGSAMLLTFGFKELKGFYSPFESAVLVGLLSVAFATAALIRINETYGTEIDFLER